MVKTFSLRSLCLFALVICMMLVTSTDAFAFGKRGKGLFGWRESAPSCTNAPSNQQSFGYKQVCENGQCFPVPESTPSVSPPPKAVETIILHKEGNAWKDASGNVWKK